MRVEPHRTADQLADLIRVQPRAKVARRLTAVRLALLGHTAPEVAGRVLLSERQVRAWVARYNAGGPGGRADRPRATACAPYAVRTCAGSWRPSSAWSVRSRPSTTCSTASGSRPCAPGGHPRGAGVGRGRIPRGQGATGAGEPDGGHAAAVPPGAESGRAAVAVALRSAAGELNRGFRCRRFPFVNRGNDVAFHALVFDTKANVIER
jgi:hypothetical protein